MEENVAVGRVIGRMVQFFLPHCQEQATLIELDQMAGDRGQWRYAHELFCRIRDKTLKAKDGSLLEWQYAFEEICAKTLFNLSNHYDPQCEEFPAPFDDDSAFWVVPFAIGFARAAGIDDRFFASCRVLLAEVP